MGLTLNLEVSRNHYAVIAGRGRFELVDVGERWFAVAIWIPEDDAPRLVGLSHLGWTILEHDCKVRLSPKLVSRTRLRVLFDAPKSLQIRQFKETPKAK